MEIWFYHLERTPLDKVLPGLLEKTLANQWRALISSPDPARLSWLDQWLWSYADDSFLPHSLSTLPRAEQQPILLTTDSKNENDSQVAFLLDGADPSDFAGFERAIVMFDDADTNAVQNARKFWKTAKAKAQTICYWKQNQVGKWENLA